MTKLKNRLQLKLQTVSLPVHANKRGQILKTLVCNRRTQLSLKVPLRIADKNFELKTGRWRCDIGYSVYAGPTFASVTEAIDTYTLSWRTISMFD